MVEYNEGQLAVTDVVASHFNEPETTDTVVWGPEGECYHCFRMLLCAHSPVFERMFHTDMVEKRTQEVHIKEVDPNALEKILRFLHTGRVDIDEENLCPIITVADEFGIQILLDVCEDFVIKHLVVDESNWFRLFTESMVAAGTMDFLVGKCQSFLSRNTLAIVTSEEFHFLEFEIVIWIAKDATDQVHAGDMDPAMYYEVVRSLMVWLESGKNIKHGIELFAQLNLGALAPSELSALCSTDLMQQTPELSLNIVKVIAAQPLSPKTPPGTSHARHLSAAETEATPLYQSSVQGVWEEWVVPVRDWYYILCTGAHGADVGDGSFPPAGGGCGAQVGGAFYLQQEDKIKMLLGWTRRGGGASCAVVVPSKWRKKTQLVLVGGGGGAAGGMGNDSGPGRDAKLGEGHLLNDPKEVAVNHGCGVQIAKRIALSSLCPSSLFLRGECLWCDGGIKGGGGGYHVGAGSVMGGGDGGGSFVSSIAENVTRGYCSIKRPSVSIWKGRELSEESKMYQESA